MKTRRPTPIWGAARPTPFAATLVSYMSSTRVRRSSSNTVTRAAARCRTGSPVMTMGRTLMRQVKHAAAAASESRSGGRAGRWSGCERRASDRRYAEADGRLARAVRGVLQRRPRVTAGSAPDGIRPPVHAGVGDEVVRGAVGHGHGHGVTRSRHLRAVGHGEVHESVVASAAREPAGLRVLAPLGRGDEHLDLTAFERAVLSPADLLLEGDQPLEALLDDLLGHLMLHRRGRSARSDGVLEGEGAGEACRPHDVEGGAEVLLRLAGEADDDVGRDRRVGDVLTDAVDDA